MAWRRRSNESGAFRSVGSNRTLANTAAACCERRRLPLRIAHTQKAYNEASTELIAALEQVEAALQSQGAWLCGNQLTIADVRLFPTLIRWEQVYAPLFRCSAKPLWKFPALWRWRQRFYALPGVADTCDGVAWRADYFGALFPLNPGGLIPAGPDLRSLISAPEPLR